MKIFSFIGLIIFIFLSCLSNRDNSDIEKPLSDFGLTEMICIDTLNVDSLIFFESENFQSELLKLANNKKLKITKCYGNENIDSVLIEFNNIKFNLLDYKGQFDNDTLLYNFSIQLEYYIIKYLDNTYFIFIANNEDCCGSMCRQCDYLLFHIDKEMLSTRLTVIDFWENNLQKIIPSFGIFNNSLCFYQIEQDENSEMYTLVPFKYQDSNLHKITDTNGQSLFLKIRLLEKNAIVVDYNWM